MRKFYDEIIQAAYEEEVGSHEKINALIAELAAFEAVAEAARTGRGLDDALDKLDALRKERQ